MPTWPGATVYRSTDGSTYSSLVSSSVSVAWGKITTPLAANFFYNCWDTTNSFTVRLVQGSLSSATRLQVMNDGANAFALGTHGRWMIGGFTDATLNADGSWTISGILQGRRGTEWACGTSVAGDKFVLLTASSLIRRALPITDVDVTRYYKAVTIGSLITSVNGSAYVIQGQDLMPYAPCHITGTRDGSDNLTIDWVRRTRLGGSWVDGTGTVPLGEDSERYQIDVYDGADVVRTLPTSSTYYTTPTGTYSAADQTTDFGSTQSSVTVKVYQISAQVGRGFGREATI